MDDYTIIREIGHGGMGSVYEGRSPSGERVAIKMMSNKVTVNPEFRELFYSEVKALRKMSHPSVVRIVGNYFSDADGNLYLPMEFVDGMTIEQYVGSQAMDEDDALKVFKKLLDAFVYIHRVGCIHRDIKPSNVMLRPDGSVCVIDFGIAKDAKTSTGKTIGRIIGTDGYMSPEQAKGDSVDYRTDIYSLGCLLHFMLTGHHAIAKKSNDYETICSILDDDFPLARLMNPTVTEHTQKVILKSVNKNMLMRYQTVEDFRNAFDARTRVAPGRKVVTVGRKDADIVIPSDYVSSRHLEIEYINNAEPPCFNLTDHSLNGTGVDGRYLHHASTMVSFGSNGELPEVLLAGRAECALEWSEVIRRLGIEPSPPPLLPPPGVSDESVKSIGFALGALSVFFPVVGWVLWGVWREKTPRRARQAAICGWVGFAIEMIIKVLM